jgi:hypothetical protein
MTKEFQMTNPESSRRATGFVSSLGLCHSLVIMVSSFVIHAMLFAIRVYQLTVSPMQTLLFGPSAGCRFTPSCSQYAEDAVRVHGALTGSWLAAKRICRCHPWGGCGCDPVPPATILKLETSHFKTHGS